MLRPLALARLLVLASWGAQAVHSSPGRPLLAAPEKHPRQSPEQQMWRPTAWRAPAPARPVNTARKADAKVKRREKVALCFFGLTRSLAITVPTIRDFLLQPLQAAGYSVDIFLHTYDLSHISSAWSGEHDDLNTSEWRLLEPLGLIEAEVTSQAQFLHDRRGDIEACEHQGSGWPFAAGGGQVLLNHLCQLHSLSRVSALWQRRHAAANYTAVVYARPDVFFNCPLPAQLLSKLQPRHLYLPDHNKWPLNDRFALARPEVAATYGDRLAYTFEQCRKPKARENAVHSERFLKKMTKDAGIVAVDIPRLYFYRIRANGLAEAKDFMSQPGCDWNRLGGLRIEVRHAMAVVDRHRWQVKAAQAA